MPAPVFNDPDVIRLQSVTYNYPVRQEHEVLQKFDLCVRRGEYLLISGASGSGKSTLCRTFNGLIPHFYGGKLRGSLLVYGRPTTQQSVTALFDKVGMVFQNPQAQLFNRTVAQELAFGLESLGLTRTQMSSRIKALAAEIDIEKLLPRNPQSLSGGEQHLVALAAVLILQPDIVVLDEPLANLDSTHIEQLRGLIRQSVRQGTGVVVCEHRMVPTLPDAHRMVLMDQGRKMADGSPEQVLRKSSWQTCGVEIPLAVRIGLRLGLSPLPQTIEQVPDRGILVEEDITDLCPYQTSVNTAPPGPPVLQVEQARYAMAGRLVVKDVSLTLSAGECKALVGANGAGKTTLLRMITGLLRPHGGRILVHSKPSGDRPAWELAQDIGTAFQNPNSQFFKLTVREEVLVGPKTLDRYDPQWIQELTALFQLEHLLERSPFKLSGGEKKRVAFAAALAAKPSLLLLDEPTAGQDGRFRNSLAKVLKKLCNQGTAILIVTHTLSFAESVADTWLVMAEGEIIGRGAPREMMADHHIMQRAGLAPTEAFKWWQKCSG